MSEILKKLPNTQVQIAKSATRTPDKDKNRRETVISKESYMCVFWNLLTSFFLFWETDPWLIHLRIKPAPDTSFLATNITWVESFSRRGCTGCGRYCHILNSPSLSSNSLIRGKNNLISYTADLFIVAKGYAEPTLLRLVDNTRMGHQCDRPKNIHRNFNSVLFLLLSRFPNHAK